MTVQEFFLLYDTKRPRDPGVDFAGRLTEKDCDEMYRMLQ